MLRIDCRSCGRLLQENSKFCAHCGISVFDTTAVFNPIRPTIPTVGEDSQWISFKQILTLYAYFMLASLIYGLVTKKISHPMIEVIYWLTVTVLTFYYVILNWMSLREIFKFKIQNFQRYVTILCAAVVTVLFLKFYFQLFDLLKSETVNYSSSILKNGWPIWSVFFLISVCPGIVEELAFRGVIYTKLKETFAIREAMIIQAACFSILHLLPTIFISHFVMGFFLGWVREKTGSLYLSIFFHIGWNASVVYFQLPA